MVIACPVNFFRLHATTCNKSYFENNYPLKSIICLQCRESVLYTWNLFNASACKTQIWGLYFFSILANEFRVWLLQYSLPCLSNLLNTDHYCHYMCLVNGIALLCGDSISNADVDLAEQLLMKFCATFAGLYGRFNLLVSS